MASRNLTKVSLVLSLEHPVGGRALHELFLAAERANRLALVTPPRDDATLHHDHCGSRGLNFHRSGSLGSDLVPLTTHPYLVSGGPANFQSLPTRWNLSLAVSDPFIPAPRMVKMAASSEMASLSMILNPVTFSNSCLI